MTTTYTLVRRLLRVSRIEPRLGPLETAYQADVLRHDAEQAQYILLLSVAGHAIWLVSDLVLAGSQGGAARHVPPFALESAITVGCAAALRYTCRTRSYELIVLGWSLSYGVFVLYLRALGSVAFPQATIPLLALITYIGLPNRLSFRVAPALVVTAGDWWMTVTRSDGPAGSGEALLITYLLVHIVGIWASARAYTARRRHFVAHREEEVARHELALAVNHDALTGVLSRARWMGLAGTEMTRHRRYERPLTLLMADLDHFKNVNDEYGHEAGDRVLERFGEILNRECRRTDIVGRIGGEEFAILLPETELGTGRDVGQRIIDACRCPQQIAGVDVSVSCSIGATNVEPMDVTIEDVLRRADAAMYAAKRTGRNRLEIAESQS